MKSDNSSSLSTTQPTAVNSTAQTSTVTPSTTKSDNSSSLSTLHPETGNTTVTPSATRLDDSSSLSTTQPTSVNTTLHASAVTPSTTNSDNSSSLPTMQLATVNATVHVSPVTPSITEKTGNTTTLFPTVSPSTTRLGSPSTPPTTQQATGNITVLLSTVSSYAVQSDNSPSLPTTQPAIENTTMHIATGTPSTTKSDHSSTLLTVQPATLNTTVHISTVLSSTTRSDVSSRLSTMQSTTGNNATGVSTFTSSTTRTDGFSSLSTMQPIVGNTTSLASTLTLSTTKVDNSSALPTTRATLPATTVTPTQAPVTKADNSSVKFSTQADSTISTIFPTTASTANINVDHTMSNTSRNVSSVMSSTLARTDSTKPSTVPSHFSQSSTTPLIPTRPPLCHCITCLNGGTCIDTELDNGTQGFQCLCPLPFVGDRCEDEQVIRYPSFDGMSGLQKSIPRSSSLTISVVFSASGPGDLVTAIGVDGRSRLNLVVLAQSILCNARCTGSSEVFHLQQELPYPIRQNVVSVRFSSNNQSRCSVSIKVNDNAEVVSEGAGALIVDTVIFGQLYPNNASHPSFTGCLYSVLLNGSEVDPLAAGAVGYGIGNCGVSSCSYRPCRNGGSCLDQPDGWQCHCQAEYAGVYCERRLCEYNPCMHGGSCVVSGDGEYICICPYGRHGVDCSIAANITQPSFQDAVLGYSSFLSYPKIWGIADGATFRMEFSTSDPASISNSLLVFTGQRSEGRFGADYLAFGLDKGYALFTYDLGSGPAFLRSLLPLNSSVSLHLVEFGYQGPRGWLNVMGQATVTGNSSGLLTGMNSRSGFYVGGTDISRSMMPANLPLLGQYKGCIFSILFKPLGTTQWRLPGYPPGVVETGRNVQQCPRRECDTYFCDNGGTCVEFGASFRCMCPLGWSGMLCKDPSLVTACDMGNHNCSMGSTCVPQAGGEHQCLCPLGRKGTFCSENISISDPMFVGEASHMSFTNMDLRRYTSVELQIKPFNSTGLILYSAQYLSENSGDFLSVTLIQGYAELRINLGGEETLILRSSGRLSLDGRWHTICVERNWTDASLSLDGITVYGTVPGRMTLLDTSTRIFLGGLPDLSALSRAAMEGEPIAFEGCVRKMVINSRNLLLNVEQGTQGVNVLDCDGTSCGYNVCLNGGTCSSESTKDFSCNCTSDFYGVYCDQPITCRDRCLNGGQCISASVGDYHCVCPLNYSGGLCQGKADESKGYRFTGDGSFLMIGEIPAASSPNTPLFSLNISTVMDGLILWQGAVSNDYFGMGVACGRLKIVFRSGLNQSREILISDQFIADGLFHSILLYSDGLTVDVQIDSKHSSTAFGPASLLAYSAVYFGSVGLGESISDITGISFHQPFQGCIKYIRVAGKPISSGSSSNLDVC